MKLVTVVEEICYGRKKLANLGKIGPDFGSQDGVNLGGKLVSTRCPINLENSQKVTHVHG